ncbi:MAG TPA: hypothetical protein VM677_23255 [Actinokineospora sp.]|jgi:hypothetical protein|nr:hypothetical protein [Actinokineospora sp.]
MRTKLLTLLAACTLVVLNATPAAAGGPTSVLLVYPESQRAAAVYHSDSAYKRLENALEGGSTEPANPDGSYVTATWLIHDVQVWRTDRVYLTSSGPVIETRTTMNDSNIWDAPATWHTSSAPADLLALLDTLGVTDESTTARIAARANSAPPPVTQAATPRDVRWEWGIGGIVVGGLLALAAVRLRQRLVTPR